MALSSVNPATGTLIRKFKASGRQTAMSRIADTAQAAEQYRDTLLMDRAMWLKKLAGILEQEMEELATLITTETGKPIRGSREEILQCATFCRYYAENATALFEDGPSEDKAKRSTTTWEPVGIVLVLTACSAPFWEVFRLAVPALLGGNGILLRHASQVPQCALEMQLLLRRAGFQPDVFQTLMLNAADVLVLNDERISGLAAAVADKGSRELAADLARQGKPVVMERQAESAVIVMPSANVFAAIQAGVAAVCIDNGESPAATSRFIIHEDIYDEFAALFASAMEDVRVGNPLKDETELGPLTTSDSSVRLKAQIASAVAAGARVLTGGDSMVGIGNYFEPTVLSDVSHDALVCRQSIQGPVALLIKVNSIQLAIEAANQRYTEAVSVWTLDAEEQKHLSRRLMGGTIFLNAPAQEAAATAGSSVLTSGIALALAKATVRTFMTSKTVINGEEVESSDFNFAMTLESFELRGMEAMEAGEENLEPEPAFALQEAEVEDDIFTASYAAVNLGLPQPSSAVEITSSIAVSAPATVAILEKPELMKKLGKVFAGTWTNLRLTTTTLQEALHKPLQVPVTEPVQEPAASERLVEKPALLTFQEMFERSLKVRP